MKLSRNRTAIKEWLEILAIVIAAPWALYNFYLEKILAPKELPVFLSVNADIKKVGENSAYEMYDVKILLHNNSKVKETVVASWFNILGERLAGFNYKTNASFVDSINHGQDNFYRYPRAFNATDSINETIHWGRLLDVDSKMNPDEEYTTDFVTVIPKQKFDALTISVSVVTGKGDPFKVNWNIDNDGFTNAKFIDTTSSKNDTLFFDEIKSSKNKKFKELVEKLDLRYTVSEHQFGLTMFEDNLNNLRIVTNKQKK